MNNCIFCEAIIDDDQVLCEHCSTKLHNDSTKPVSYEFNEDKRPKFKYIDRYGGMDKIYEKLCNGESLLMDGFDFEYFCADLLLIEGFTNIEVTKASADNGADIVATKNNKKYIFQCKCVTHTCSNKAVQEIISANTIYKADKMAVICNTNFSDHARALAHTNHVDLYSIGNIRHMLDKYVCDFYEV